MKKKERVVVGLSGGVDSSVTAYLLLEQGYEVIGMFMRNWHDDSVILDDECPWIEDSNDALLVAEQLNIPFQVIDLSAEYKKRIVDYMFSEYEAGRTPNPDVLCNREIKFDVFLDAALKIGADYVATGHYCQKESVTQADGTVTHRLLAGADLNKDQSYFLCQVSQEQLAKAIFPIGGMQKPEVRLIAENAGLATAKKKDSQGLCFVGKISLPDFLQQQLKPKKGDIIEISKDSSLFEPESVLAGEESDLSTLRQLTRPYRYAPSDGEKVGTHNGAHFYTIGQRKGLGVGGKAEPLFVLDTDVETNTVYVGQGAHPGLFREGLFVAHTEVHWVRPDRVLTAGMSARYQARIRYRQPLSGVTLHATESGIYFIFDRPQRGVTPGQFVVWYDGNELVGSGVIA
ncbi:MAG: tRNA 2-thiouridine(34) synthase MnmA [Bacteroidota bacterium]